MRRATLSDFFINGARALRPPEEALRMAVASGSMATIGSGARPSETGRTKDNAVRAEFIRYLALGGCDECRPTARGVRLSGAWIDGPLDLEYCELACALKLQNCVLPDPVNLRDAKALFTSFEGSAFRGSDAAGVAIAASRLEVSGDLHFNHSDVSGELRLRGAQINGDLDFRGAKIRNPNGYGVYAVRLKTLGTVHMTGGAEFFGGVSLLGGTIGGNLSIRSCLIKKTDGRAINAAGTTIDRNVFIWDEARLEGRTDFRNTQVGGDFSLINCNLENHNGTALDLYGARIRQALIIRARAGREKASAPLIHGRIHVNNAHVGALADSAPASALSVRLLMDGFKYDRISGAPTDARRRVRWLEKQIPEHLAANFQNQPWEQLRATLTAQGEALEAKRVGVAHERAKRRAGKIAWYALPFHRLYGFVVGYGYFTIRALLFAAVLWALAFVSFLNAWRDGAMVPTDAVMLESAGWRTCVETAPDNPAACWTAARRPGADCETFKAGLYAFDVFLPLVSLEQEIAWSPSPGRGALLSETPIGRALPRAALGAWTLGDLAWVHRILHEVMGYLLSAFAVAGAARLVREE